MIETTPTPAMTDTELEDWFSEAGLSATVVERCPVVGVPVVRTAVERRPRRRGVTRPISAPPIRSLFHPCGPESSGQQ